MIDLKAVRKKAWKTRRKKYGPRGNCGVYSRVGVARIALKRSDLPTAAEIQRLILRNTGIGDPSEDEVQANRLFTAVLKALK